MNDITIESLSTCNVWGFNHSLMEFKSCLYQIAIW